MLICNLLIELEFQTLSALTGVWYFLLINWTTRVSCPRGLHPLPWASYQIRKIACAHAPGMPGSFSPPPLISVPNMQHGTCVTHVPWCMPGSLTSSFLWSRRRGKIVPGIPGACATRSFMYPVRGPCLCVSFATSQLAVLCGQVIVTQVSETSLITYRNYCLSYS